MMNTAKIIIPIAGMAVLSGAQAQDRRPDIVLLLADDWGFPHAAPYGDRVVDSRVFDQIASEGMLFTRAYSAAPHSSPSRACILTGCYAHRLGEACNLNCYFPRELTVYPQILEEAGYETVYWHKGWGPGVFTATGWEHNPAGHEVTDLAAWIREVPSDKPICAWMGSRRPHRPYTVGSGEAHGFNPDSLVLCPDLPDAPDVRTDVADYYYNIQLFQDECQKVIDALRESGRLDNTLLVITSDNGYSFPRAKSNLYDLGCHVPMAIRWPGVVEPGTVCDGFVSLMDLTATFYEAAGAEGPKGMDSRSMMPVLEGRRNGTRKELYLDRERHTNTRPGGYGYPMRALVTRDWHYVENLHPERLPAGEDPVFGDTGNGPAKAYMSFCRDEYPSEIFERAFGLRPAEELYHVSADPDCIVNLADENVRVRKRMSSKLHRWMKATGDPRVDPEDLSFDEYPYVRKAMKAVVVEIEGTVTDASGKVLPWVADKVKELSERGLRMFVTSSLPEAELKAFLADNLGNVSFERIYSGIDPSDIDSYVALLNGIVSLTGLSPREVTHIGDDERDVLACKKTGGVIPVGVTWGDLDAKGMLMAGASYVLSDREDLDLCLDFL